MARDDENAIDTVAPGALTKLLRDAARSPVAARGGRLPAFRPGQVIDRFELVREIGRGGFGVVYEAVDRKLGRAVAFKAVRMGADLDLREDRLLREAEAAAQLSHPNIVTLHDVGECEHGPYLVLELLRGRTLAERLEEGAIPLREAIAIAIEVAEAVAHAHARGVVHRDLTPRNVFLCEDGHAKVLDLGMARAFGGRTQEGGTGAYMAPEQRRAAPEDERTDVFAMGVILLEMLTGALPLADANRHGDDLHRLELSCGAAVADLVGRMLAVDPVERPRDGGAVLAALGALAPERDDAPAAPARPPTARGRRSAAVAVAGALVVASLAAVASWKQRDAPAGVATAARAHVDVAEAKSADPSAKSPFAAAPPAPVVARIAGPVGEAPERSAPPAPTLPARRDATVSLAVTDGAPGRTGRAHASSGVRECRGRLGGIPTPSRESGDGVLIVLADPFGAVFVNGKRRGDTPGECLVAAGTYAVRVLHPELGARQASVKVVAGERATWAADFLATEP